MKVTSSVGVWDGEFNGASKGDGEGPHPEK